MDQLYQTMGRFYPTSTYPEYYNRASKLEIYQLQYTRPIEHRMAQSIDFELVELSWLKNRNFNYASST